MTHSNYKMIINIIETAAWGGQASKPTVHQDTGEVSWSPIALLRPFLGGALQSQKVTFLPLFFVCCPCELSLERACHQQHQEQLPPCYAVWIPSWPPPSPLPRGSTGQAHGGCWPFAAS